MATNHGKDEGHDPVKGIAADILKEVIRADMSMHAAQIEAWESFAQHRPKGEFINNDIHDGFARNMFLGLSELKLQLYVRPVRLNLWSRLKLAFRVLFSGAVTTTARRPVVHEISSQQEKGAMLVEITVVRHRNGTVKAEYKPVDSFTEDLLKH